MLVVTAVCMSRKSISISISMSRIVILYIEEVSEVEHLDTKTTTDNSVITPDHE